MPSRDCMTEAEVQSLFRSLEAAKAIEQKWHADADSATPKPPQPFVTISRQAGAGGRSFGQHLVQRINELHPGRQPWKCWDRELVEKIAADHHVAEELVEAINGESRSWLQDFLIPRSNPPQPRTNGN